MFFADHEVLIGKLISNIPADGSEFPPVLDDSVEKAETEQQFFVFLSLFAFIEVLLIHIAIGSKEVVPKSLRRLQGHLDAVLQDRDREAFSRHRGQPEPEVFMHTCIEAFAEQLKLRHPADR